MTVSDFMLVCFATSLLCFAMPLFVMCCYVLLRFGYVLLCVATFWHVFTMYLLWFAMFLLSSTQSAVQNRQHTVRLRPQGRAYKLLWQNQENVAKHTKSHDNPVSLACSCLCVDCIGSGFNDCLNPVCFAMFLVCFDMLFLWFAMCFSCVAPFCYVLLQF